MVNGRGNLESVEKNSLLSLEKDVTRPSHESGQITLMLDSVSDSIVSRSLLEKRVLLSVSFLLSLLVLSLLSFSHFKKLIKSFLLRAQKLHT